MNLHSLTETLKISSYIYKNYHFHESWIALGNDFICISAIIISLCEVSYTNFSVGSQKVSIVCSYSNARKGYNI